jgi:general secretion pathway protein C
MRYIARLSRLVWALNIALLAVVASLIGVAVFPTRPSGSGAAPTDQASSASRAAAAHEPAASVDSKLILERDIFRVGQAAAAEEAKKVPNVPPERPKIEPKRELPLRLLGTVVDEGGASLAVIENSGVKSQDVYRLGDRIGDMRVTRIEQNRVVLLSGGVSQTLDLLLTGQNAGGAKVVAEAPAPAPASEPVNAGGGPMVRVASATERQINARVSAENRNQATEFLRKLKVAPHQTDGKADGLSLSGVGDSALAQLSGLKDGDVIQTINGHPVPNETKAAQVLKKARNLGTASLGLQRGQESTSLTFRTDSW